MEEFVYSETLSSTRTESLFLALTLVFLGLLGWRWTNIGWAITFLVFSLFFIFYVFNYKSLKVNLATDFLKLAFGIFIWIIDFANIENCYLDEPSIGSLGGAGIHFTWIKGNYRAFFNFLEHPRVVVVLKKKKGPVQEIAFSTRNPEQLIEIIQNRLSQPATSP